MATRADISRVARDIREDLMILAGHTVGQPSNASWQDVAGTLATNMEVFADALHEERKGRMSFIGRERPTESVWRILGEEVET